MSTLQARYLYTVFPRFPTAIDSIGFIEPPLVLLKILYRKTMSTMCLMVLEVKGCNTNYMVLLSMGFGLQNQVHRTL